MRRKLCSIKYRRSPGAYFQITRFSFLNGCGGGGGGGGDGGGKGFSIVTVSIFGGGVGLLMCMELIFEGGGGGGGSFFFWAKVFDEIAIAAAIGNKQQSNFFIKQFLTEIPTARFSITFIRKSGT